MEVKIFKWANVILHCRHDQKMLNAFQDFKSQLSFCNWKIPSDITKSFRTADIVPCKGKAFNRVIFNIGGNKYRMICGYKFSKNKVVLYIRFVGTHLEYDNVNVCDVDIFSK